MPIGIHISAPFLEKQTLEGLRYLAMVLWPMTTRAVQRNYPHFRPDTTKLRKGTRGKLADHETYFPLVRHEVQLALHALNELGCVPQWAKDPDGERQNENDAKREAGTWLIAISFVRCSLGSPGTLRDVERYFLGEERKKNSILLQHQGELDRYRKNPEYMLDWVANMLRHEAEHEFELRRFRLPEEYIRSQLPWSEKSRQGMTAHRMAAEELHAKIDEAVVRIQKIELILEELREGKFAGAIEYLAHRESVIRKYSPDYVEAKADPHFIESELIEEMLYGEFPSSVDVYGRVRLKEATIESEKISQVKAMGELSRFIRTAPGGGKFWFARNLVQSDYYLPTALLETLYPGVGNA